MTLQKTEQLHSVVFLTKTAASSWPHHTIVAVNSLNDYRQSILPLNLEKQLFLKINKALWDTKAVTKVMANADAPLALTEHS